MENTSTLVDSLTLRYGDTEILGSQLGNAIAKWSPGLSLRAYGGLRAFVEAELGGAIEWLRREGLDDFYRVAAKKLADYGQWERPSWSTPQLWSSFTNPNRSVRLAVAVDGKSLLITTSPDAPLPDGVVELKRLSTDSYRSMAANFLAGLPDESTRAELSPLLGGNPFWNAWIDGVSKHEQKAAWESFRVSAIDKEFLQQLAAAGIEEARSREMLTALHSSKNSQRPKGRSANATHRAPANLPHGRAELLRLVRETIERLSDEELRSLRLPVGVILDVVRQR